MKYKNLNLKYALVNAAYLMMLCATAGYSYNFLSQIGFQDGTVGIIIALISVCGVIGQTISGSIIDKSEKLDEKTFISLSMIVTIILSFLLILYKSQSVLTILLVVVCFTSAAIGMPFLNSMAFIYEQEGQTINYGLGRGVGSAAYAVGSALLGRLWSWGGKDILPIYVLALACLVLLSVRLMPTAKKQASEGEAGEKVSQISYGEFFRKYNKIVLVVASLILLYFCHMLVNTYFAKVITNIIGEEAAAVSGTVEGIQGTALFIQAMVELPTMFTFALILKKVSVNKLLMIAAVIYSLKHIMILFCPNVPMLYVSMVLQMFSYAIIVPAAVYFSNENVAAEDRNKGQAVMGVTATIGGLLASLIGGQLFQYMSISAVLTIGVVASCIGTVLMIVGIRNSEKQS